MLVHIVILTFGSIFGSHATEPSLCEMTNYLYQYFNISASDVNYLLFTSKNPKQPCDLQPDVEALKTCHFDPNLETKVLIHGFITKIPLPQALVFVIKDRFLEENDYNVVVVNWTSYTQDNSKEGYAFSAMASIFVGLRLSSWIRFLQLEAGAKPEKFHLIAHSLGTNVASYAGKSICTIGRITCLDAAGPIFNDLPSYIRVNSDDALYVEAIHTSQADSVLFGKGLMFAIGHVDYYPDGGTNQTHCFRGSKYQLVTGETQTDNSPDNRVSCNHNIVLTYVLQSFKEKCKFRGLVCDSYEDFKSGKCNADNAEECEMGVYSTDVYDLPKHSKCYVKTSDKAPYCMN